MANVVYDTQGVLTPQPRITRRRKRERSPRARALKSRNESELLHLVHAMEQADRHKNTFLATLSHELRNPLAPIRNSVHLLRLTPAGGEQAKRALSIIERQVDHMTRLIDDLTDLTRISQGKVGLRFEPVDLRQLLLDAFEDHAPIFSQRGVELTLAAPKELRVDGDRERLAEVVGNLLQNAAKFTSRGGKTLIDLSHSGSADEAVIRVRDTGIGIAADLLANVFEPFVQAHAGEDDRSGGLGLGLAVVKGLVELHGGKVFVHSQGLGRGAEFTIRLPIHKSVVLRPGCT